MENKCYPKCGEVWYAHVEPSYANSANHNYIGTHPYLITSNNKFNDKSGMVNAIPFSSKRFKHRSPAHVNFKAGEISGLTVDSTLMCENETSILVFNCTKKVGGLTNSQIERVAYAMMLQKPLFAFTVDNKTKTSRDYLAIVNY